MKFTKGTFASRVLITTVIIASLFSNLSIVQAKGYQKKIVYPTVTETAHGLEDRDTQGDVSGDIIKINMKETGYVTVKVSMKSGETIDPMEIEIYKSDTVTESPSASKFVEPGDGNTAEVKFKFRKGLNYLWTVPFIGNNGTQVRKYKIEVSADKKILQKSGKTSDKIWMGF